MKGLLILLLISISILSFGQRRTTQSLLDRKAIKEAARKDSMEVTEKTTPIENKTEQLREDTTRRNRYLQNSSASSREKVRTDKFRDKYQAPAPLERSKATTVNKAPEDSTRRNRYLKNSSASSREKVRTDKFRDKYQAQGQAPQEERSIDTKSRPMSAADSLRRNRYLERSATRTRDKVELGRHRDKYTSAAMEREAAEQPKMKKLSTLNKATGYIHAPWGDEILIRNKEIINFDNFDRLEFQTLEYKGATLFAFDKKYKSGYYSSNDISGKKAQADQHSLYIIDRKQFQDKVDLTKDKDVVMLDVILRRNIIDGDKYPPIYNLENVEKTKLVIKYDKDEIMKTARFLIYVLEYDATLVTGLNNTDGNDLFLTQEDKMTEEKFKLIKDVKFHEDFYYDTDYNSFMNFMKGPYLTTN